MSSIIKVDNIQDQCGSAVVTKCGASKTLTVTTAKANNYQAADGGNIINQCGTTITLGASGDTITLACGASQTGFGRTGTVNWDTTAKTAGFTAVSGNGYFVNTTSGAITVTLPAGNAGDIVGISDYASTFQTNNVTIAPNGSDNINGVNQNATLSTQGIAVSLVYVDATRGWKSVTGSDNDTTGVIPPAFTVATGGTITCCGDYKIHTFTGPGTFCVSQIGNGPTVCGGGPINVDYLVVAGGGGGGGAHDVNTHAGGGGGAGGYRTSYPSPLGTLPVSVQGYPITVGAGAPGGPGNQGGTPEPNGGNSIFSSITSTGGGSGGGGNENPAVPTKNAAGGNGGSGGGGGRLGHPNNGGAGGSGNTPPVSPPQGNNGAAGAPNNPGPALGGGGGGAAGNASGQTAGSSSCNSITGSTVGYSGGGRGGDKGPGGTGCSGAANRGYGGDAGSTPNGAGGAGGSGVVIIRYKFQ